jgi:hypothetical protein
MRSARELLFPARVPKNLFFEHAEFVHGERLRGNTAVFPGTEKRSFSRFKLAAMMISINPSTMHI